MTQLTGAHKYHKRSIRRINPITKPNDENGIPVHIYEYQQPEQHV